MLPGAVAKLAAECTDGVLAVEEEAPHPVAVMLHLPQTKLLSKASIIAEFQVPDAIWATARTPSVYP